MASSAALDVAIAVFDDALRGHIAETAPDRIFVHAGVVAHRGKAILIPGPSLAGKTTLVAALVAAGRMYYSDEMRCWTIVGRSTRTRGASRCGARTGRPEHKTSRRWGGQAGTSPLPIGLIVLALYRPGATWQPRRLSPGEGVLALLANTIAVQTRPDEALVAATRAVSGATAVLEGERGSAPELASQLLASDLW